MNSSISYCNKVVLFLESLAF